MCSWFSFLETSLSKALYWPLHHSSCSALGFREQDKNSIAYQHCQLTQFPFSSKHLCFPLGQGQLDTPAKMQSSLQGKNSKPNQLRALSRHLHSPHSDPPEGSLKVCLWTWLPASGVQEGRSCPVDVQVSSSSLPLFLHLDKPWPHRGTLEMNEPFIPLQLLSWPLLYLLTTEPPVYWKCNLSSKTLKILPYVPSTHILLQKGFHSEQLRCYLGSPQGISGAKKW